MFSKEDAKRIRQEFWISFGKSFPRKWILYNTRLKGVSFKFHFEKKYAKVSVNFEHSDPEIRFQLYEKFAAFKSILDEKIPNLEYHRQFLLENGKEISSIFVQIMGVSIHNKDSWQEVMHFLKNHMTIFEEFWLEYEDFIRN